MSDCDQARLHALHEAALPPELQAEVAAHVASCGACQRTLAEWRALDGLLATHPPDVPSGYFDALPARIATRAKAPRRRAAWAHPAAWAAALAAAVLIAVVTPRLLDSPVVPDPRPVPSTKAAPEPQRARPSAERTPGADRESREPEASARQAVPAGDTAQAPVETAAEKRQVSVPETRAARRPAPAAGAAPQAPLAERTAPPAVEPVLQRTGALAVATDAGLADDQERAAAAASEAPPANSSAAGFAAKSAPSTPPLRLQRARADRDRLSAEAERLPHRSRAQVDALRRALAAAVEAARSGGQSADRTALRRLAETYLPQVDAAEQQRVRALLAEWDR